MTFYSFEVFVLSLWLECTTVFVAASVCYWVSLKPAVHRYLFAMDTLCSLITLPGYLLHYGYSKFQNAIIIFLVSVKIRWQQVCYRSIIVPWHFDTVTHLITYHFTIYGGKYYIHNNNNDIYLLILCQLKLLWGGKLQFVLIFCHAATVYQETDGILLPPPGGRLTTFSGFLTTSSRNKKPFDVNDVDSCSIQTFQTTKSSRTVLLDNNLS